MIKSETSSGLHWLASILVVLILFTTIGCESDAKSGALVGAGVGALIGQAAGGSTSATLIGAGIGTGAGYMIGNEKDKKKAKESSNAHGDYSTADSPLSGTTWQVLSVVPDPETPFKSMTVYFRPDGYVDTTKTLDDGTLRQASERYRTVGSTLIVNKPGYLINAEFLIDGKQLIVTCEKFRAVLVRVGS